MVEMQRAQVPVVATDQTAAACLGDQRLLDLSPMLSHALDSAAPASVVPPALEDEFTDAVISKL